jgi:hypothetical protein
LAASVLYVGDQDPSLPTIVKDGSGNVMDLTGYLSVMFALALAYGTTTVFKAAAVFVAPRTAGTIRYDLGANDLSGILPGRYVGQWVLVDSNSKPQHVDAGLFDVRVGY